MRWDFWEFMLLVMSMEIPLLIAPEVSESAARWLPIGKSHFHQLAILVLTAIFVYGLVWFATHPSP
jgi:hypothetical protein